MAKYGLDLQQKNKSKSRKMSVFIIVFLCFCLFLGSVSMLLLWRSYNYDFSNIFVKQDESTTTVITTAKPQNTAYSGNYEFLVAVTNDSKTQSLFFNIITVDLGERVIRVVPVDDTITEVTSGMSCGDILIKKGINETVGFLNDFYGIGIDRYAVLTENGYKSFFRAMGDITVKISQDVEYDTADMFLELSRGENTLTPDKTYKYMKYLCETLNGYERAKANAEIVVAAFNSFYTSERFNSADNTFSIIIDYCETDISIVDYTNAKDELEYLLPQTSKEKMKVFVSENVKSEKSEESSNEE